MDSDALHIRELADAIARSGPPAPVRLRQGTIISVQSDKTATVTIGGSDVEVAGVKVMSRCCPKPGAACWLATDGRDMMVLGHLAPVGPVYLKARRGTDQTIGNDTLTTVAFGTPPTELSDAWGMQSSTSAFLAPLTGLYYVSFRSAWDTNTTGYREADILVGGAIKASERKSAAPGALTYATVSEILSLTTGDAITIQVRQTSTGNLALVGGGANQSVLRIVWQGFAG